MKMDCIKKIALILYLIVVSNNVFCQDTITRKPRRLSYGLNFGAAANYRFLKSTNAENYLQEQRNSDEISRLGYSFGLLLNYRLTEKFTINSGIQYEDFGFKTRKQNLLWVDNNTTTPSFVDYHYKYITIPINLKYSFYKNGSWTIFTAGGISPTIFIQLKKVLHYNDGDGWHENFDKQGVGYDRLNFIANVQLGFDYKISSRITLTANFFYKQFLKQTNSKLPTSELLNATGITAGIVYIPFKKTHLK